MKFLSVIFLVIMIACSSSKILFQESYKPIDGVDSRLKSFLEYVIKNPNELNNVLNQYKGKPISFEYFIYQIFTGKVEFDTTPDNSMALGQLGLYLEENRPELSDDLLKELKNFNENNKTMMRGMLILTIEGLKQDK